MVSYVLILSLLIMFVLMLMQVNSCQHHVTLTFSILITNGCIQYLDSSVMLGRRGSWLCHHSNSQFGFLSIIYILLTNACSFQLPVAKCVPIALIQLS